jgi:iron complex outermembrane receptor protein
MRIGPIAGGSGFVPTSDYSAPAYSTVDLRLARSFRLDRRTLDVALVGTNLGGRHQEIADRSEQAMHGNTPVNETSSLVWLNLSLRQH